MTSKSEIWKAHPDITGIEVSTLGRVRTLDRVVWNGKVEWLRKGQVLKPRDNGHGYLRVNVKVDGKLTTKYVHRLVAETFIQNLDNLPEVNHKDCNRANNNVENLEFCTRSYNRQYREKYGVSQTEAQGHPVFVINLKTLEVSHFRSQGEAGRAFGFGQGSVSSVIRGKTKQAGIYYFKEDDGNGIEIYKDKLKDIVAGMNFKRGVFAVNFKTLEVSRFDSQIEASRVLGLFRQNINAVIKGRHKQAGGFWFTNADENADDAINRKIHEIKKIYN